jgi:AcrR family transcriptional regulator
MAERMSGEQRREQILELATEAFATAGLHGTSTETLARRAGITQTYVFRLFGTKKALFLRVVERAFGRLIEGMEQAGGDSEGRDALSAMGRFYDAALADRTGLLVQLQAFAACGDPEVRDAVRSHLARMWAAVDQRANLDAVGVKTFLAFGMLLNTAAALEVREVDAEWARGIRTRIHAGLFDHLTEANNQ